MGILSKAWKGLKKAVKKVGKGIKKTFNKVMGAIGKLGIVGQIGMMFLMPYATSALGSFFGAAGKLSTWSTNLLSKAGLGRQALGHGLNLINKAGTFAGNVYNSVSTTIGNAVDRVTNFAKGKGFTLSEGRTSIFAKDITTPTTPESLTKVLEADKPFDVTTTSTEDFTKKLMEGKGEFPGVTDVSSMLDTPDLTGFVPEESMNLGKFFEADVKEAFTIPKIQTGEAIEGLTDVSQFTKPIEPLLGKTKDATFMDTLKDIPGKVVEGVKDFDIQKAVNTGLEGAVTGAIKTVGGQGLSKALGYETPEGPSSYYIDIPEMMNVGASNSSVYNQVDLMAQQQGNPYLVGNIQNSNYLNNLIGEGNSAYQSFMANFSASQNTPMQKGIYEAAGYNT
tara:strand:+ start:418 stop:1596 length:1179 start_codon:yes stop_codon:yes gene_type:complete